jgi:hypothetical protein
MEQQSATAQVDQELEEARNDLRRTLEQVNQRVEELEARLRPKAILRSNPLALPAFAGLLGFLLGSDRQPRPLRWIAIGTLLGVALAAARPGSDDGKANQ